MRDNSFAAQSYHEYYKQAKFMEENYFKHLSKTYFHWIDDIKTESRPKTSGTTKSTTHYHLNKNISTTLGEQTHTLLNNLIRSLQSCETTLMLALKQKSQKEQESTA